MPLTETFHLAADGKVIAGVTELRDPQTGAIYLVTDARSGKLPTPIDPTVDRYGLSAGGRCAMYGGPVRERKQEA
jgi:hypothetical protein